MGFALDTGELRIERWACSHRNLLRASGPFPHEMAHSVATARALVSNGELGADAIHLKSGQGYVAHTHPGNHMILVLSGRGTITYDGEIYQTEPGDIYAVEGNTPHALGAIDDHVVIAVSTPHEMPGDPSRMTPVPPQALVTRTGALHCRVCDVRAPADQAIHEVGCLHCPCPYCVTTGDDALDTRLQQEWDSVAILV